MRLLVELVVAAALIAMAWTKSFRQWASEAPLLGRYSTAPGQTRHAQAIAPATSATPPKVFTRHIYYTDEHGKTYWLDAHGKRQYKP